MGLTFQPSNPPLLCVFLCLFSAFSVSLSLFWLFSRHHVCDQSEDSASFVGRFVLGPSLPFYFSPPVCLVDWQLAQSNQSASPNSVSEQLKLPESRKTAKVFLSLSLRFSFFFFSFSFSFFVRVGHQKRERKNKAGQHGSLKLNSLLQLKQKERGREPCARLSITRLPLDAITFRCDFLFSVSFFFPIYFVFFSFFLSVYPPPRWPTPIGTLSDLGGYRKQRGQWLSLDLWLDILFQKYVRTYTRARTRQTLRSTHRILDGLLPIVNLANGLTQKKKKNNDNNEERPSCGWCFKGKLKEALFNFVDDFRRK